MTNSYDNQMLYAYLLGSLPNEDTEHLDEMTFTDPNFADQVDAAEKDLVDSYVNGELSGDMLERFESYYLSSPKRQQNVSFAKALQDFAEKEKSKPAAFAAAETDSQKEKAGMFAGILESLGALFGGRPAFGLASAALLVALLGIGTWLMVRGLGGQKGPDVAQVNGQATVTPVNTPVPPASPLPSPPENRTVVDGGNTKP